MKILYVAHRIPYPPDKGDKIRGWHFLSRLARRHTVDLACLADDREDLLGERLHVLRSLCRRVEVVFRPRPRALAASLGALPRGVPISLPFFGDPRLARVVEGWIAEGRYDAALAHSAPMAQYVPPRRGLVRVADLCDVDSQKWRQYSLIAPPPKRWVYRREANRLRSWEVELARGWDSVVLASRPEAALFRSFCREGRVEVVPNGVDAEFFVPAAPSRTETVVFTGVMDYLPNVEGVLWFASEVWPRVRRVRPGARFAIVGPRPTDAVRALHDPARGVEVRGRVPDIRDALAEAALAVAPLRIARGIQNKVLEAMASERAVVSTTAAHEGVEAVPGRDLLVADDAKTFAAEVLALLSDPERRAHIGRSARAAVLAGHAWDVHVATLERLLDGGARPAAREGAGAAP